MCCFDGIIIIILKFEIPTYDIAMKNWNLFTFNKVFFAAYFLLAVINSLAVFIEDDVFIQSLRPLSIPVLLIFFYLRKNEINTSMVFFLFFAFLSESAGSIFSDFNSVCTESMFLCIAFIQLIVLMLPRFKFTQFDGLIKVYLLMMFGVALFFFKVLYDLVGMPFLEQAEAMFFSAKSMVVVILVFISYGVYLNVQSKQSILFLIATVCFGFSNALDYLNFSFVNNLGFLVLNRVIYLLGLYFVFKFIIEENNCKVRQEPEIEESFSGDNILV